MMKTLMCRIAAIGMCLFQSAAGGTSSILPLDLSIGDSFGQFEQQCPDAKALLPVKQDEEGTVSEGVWICEIEQNTLWDSALVRIKAGGVVSVAYTNAKDSGEDVRQNVSIIFAKLVQRFGPFQRQLVVEHLMKGPRIEAPLFLWEIGDTLVGFSYTPFSKYSQEELFKCELRLVKREPNWRERFAVLYVDPNEMGELFEDVSGWESREADLPPPVDREEEQGGNRRKNVLSLAIPSVALGLLAIGAVVMCLSAEDLDGTVSDEDEETDGAFVYFNVDNDDDSDNSVEAPKRPGADYANDTTAVTDENDLKSLLPAMSPYLEEGVVVLGNNSSGELWSSDSKGSGNRVLTSYNSLSWDLSDSQERSDFASFCYYYRYVEGASGTDDGEITLRYYAPGGSMVHRDRVEYTYIAADCGNQPTTSQRAVFEGMPGNGLVHCEWSITGDATPAYNCIAYSAGKTNVFIDKLIYVNGEYHSTMLVDGVVHVSLDKVYGNKNNVFEIADVDLFYLNEAGLTPTATGPEDATVMYYDWYHAATKMGCSCGNGKWIMYESKVGVGERIEHVHDQLDNTYGGRVRYYK